MQIYVVDSLDRERIGRAKEEFQVMLSNAYSLNTSVRGCFSLIYLYSFQAIISDPFMLSSVILVFANKQDMVCLVLVSDLHIA